MAEAPPDAAARRCPRCWRARCLCDLLATDPWPVASAVPTLLLQHPRERHAFKNSARWLQLCVADVTGLSGETWASAPDAACGPADRTPAGRRDVLLYPPTPADPSTAAAPPLPESIADWLQQQDRAGAVAWRPPPGPPLRLVVIDATWRKAYRMLVQSPWLQTLPRWPLRAPPPSRYAVRRARGADQRSTFEAAVLALAMLNGPSWPLPRLMAAFDAFNGRLAAQLGLEVVDPAGPAGPA